MQHTIIISGATGVIGTQLALGLKDSFDQIVLLGRSESKLEALRKSMGKEAVRVVKVDFSKPNWSESLSLFKDIKGPTELALINCAGFGGPFKRLADVSGTQLMEVFQISYFSAFVLTQECLPKMIESGKGKIINISSVYSQHTASGSSPYSGAKAALDALTRSIAVEYGNQGIRSLSLLPGYVRSKMAEDNKSLSPLLGRVPTQSLVETQEIVQLCRLFLSGNINSINGTSLVVDGGLSCSLEG